MRRLHPLHPFWEMQGIRSHTTRIIQQSLWRKTQKSSQRTKRKLHLRNNSRAPVSKSLYHWVNTTHYHLFSVDRNINPITPFILSPLPFIPFPNNLNHHRNRNRHHQKRRHKKCKQLSHILKLLSSSKKAVSLCENRHPLASRVYSPMHCLSTLASLSIPHKPKVWKFSPESSSALMAPLPPP